MSQPRTRSKAANAISVAIRFWTQTRAVFAQAESAPAQCPCYLLISNLCRTSEGRVKSSPRGVRLADLNVLHLHWCRSLRQKSYKLTVRVLLRICEKMYVILNLKRYHCLCTAVQKSNQRTAELQRHSNSKMCRHTAGPSRRALMRRGAEVSRGCVISHPALG